MFVQRYLSWHRIHTLCGWVTLTAKTPPFELAGIRTPPFIWIRVRIYTMSPCSGSAGSTLSPKEWESPITTSRPFRSHPRTTHIAWNQNAVAVHRALGRIASFCSKMLYYSAPLSRRGSWRRCWCVRSEHRIVDVVVVVMIVFIDLHPFTSCSWSECIMNGGPQIVSDWDVMLATPPIPLLNTERHWWRRRRAKCDMVEEQDRVWRRRSSVFWWKTWWSNWIRPKFAIWKSSLRWIVLVAGLYQVLDYARYTTALVLFCTTRWCTVSASSIAFCTLWAQKAAIYQIFVD